LNAAELIIKKNNLPVGLIMKQNSVKSENLDQFIFKVKPIGVYKDRQTGSIETNRYKTLEEVVKISTDQTAIIATTGKCGRELFTIYDRPQHIYQVGSMGGASAMGLGLAMNTDKSVVVLDGDGATLMKMGNLATIGANSPKNLIHIILDNGVHDSTGGQATVSTHIDFAQVAIACGYRFAATTDDLAGFAKTFSEATQADGPTLIHAKITAGSIEGLGRPTLQPREVARRFQAFIAEN
jgi:phosphonopyruvate decarboxylase